MSVMMRYLMYVCMKKAIDIDHFYRIQISRRNIILIGNRTDEMMSRIGGDDVMITNHINIYLR
jgi:hypothetical protein